MGLAQIDSVARVVRSHYLPFFSRLGAYPRPTLDRLLYTAPRMGVEYWSHAAAYAHPETIAMLDGRRADWYRHDYGQRDPHHGAAFVRLMRELFEELQGGPGTARDLAGRVEHDVPETARDHWGWNPTRTKSALEALFAAGCVSVARRNQHFEKVFALPADVHPDLPQPGLRFGPAGDPQAGLRAGARLPRGIGGGADDVRALTLRAARALGIATVDCLADYFRQDVASTARAAQVLVDEGLLRPVTAAGTPAYLSPDAVRPRHIRAAALLAPFDPLVFNRKRIAWLFGFDYRISIYTPAAQRIHGYYVMPFLFGEQLVARVDVAAERGFAGGAGALRALAVHWEDGCGPDMRLDDGRAAGEALEAELEEMRSWLALRDLHLAIS